MKTSIDHVCESRLSFRDLNAKTILANTNPVSGIISPKICKSKAKKYTQNTKYTQNSEKKTNWKRQSVNRIGICFGKLSVIGGRFWTV